MKRGDRREVIFEEDRDYEGFLAMLTETGVRRRCGRSRTLSHTATQVNTKCRMSKCDPKASKALTFFGTPNVSQDPRMRGLAFL
jgi:hypothetical protein